MKQCSRKLEEQYRTNKQWAKFMLNWFIINQLVVGNLNFHCSPMIIEYCQLPINHQWLMDAHKNQFLRTINSFKITCQIVRTARHVVSPGSWPSIARSIITKGGMDSATITMFDNGPKRYPLVNYQYYNLKYIVNWWYAVVVDCGWRWLITIIINNTKGNSGYRWI